MGRIDGKVCFVPFSCPGDELRVRITAEKRSYRTATIVDVINPSPHRTVPPCPLFGVCGGCDWQHIDYRTQLAAKHAILAETLWRGARTAAELVADTAPSPLRYGYRSRVQLKLHGLTGPLRIGFYRQGTHFVEDAVEGCPVAMPVINEALARLRHVLASFPEPALIPQINVDCGEPEGALAIVHYLGRDTEMVRAFFAGRREELAPLTAIYLQTGRKATMKRVFGKGELSYTLPGGGPAAPPRLLSFRAGGFSQVNHDQNRAISTLIRSLVGFSGGERILDLYCGNGNFSLPLADTVSHITGVEEYDDSIAAAVDNARRNEIHHAEFRCQDAELGVRQLAREGRRFDAIILDPPRSGAAAVVREIHRLKPEKIIYVSCDPNTLARDCGLLLGQGYDIRTSIPVDMFPQTYHLESVTLLQRK